MAKGSLNITRIVTEWWTSDGLAHPVPYVILPVAAGVSVVVFDLQVDDLGSIQAGVFFLGGILMNILLRVWGWGEDIAGEVDEATDGYFSNAELRRRLLTRVDAIERLQRTVSWSVLISFGLAVGLIVANTRSGAGQAATDTTPATAVLAVLGVHLLFVLVAVVNRTVILTRSAVRHNRSRLSNVA